MFWQFFSKKQGDPEVVNIAFRELKRELDNTEHKLKEAFQYKKIAKEEENRKLMNLEDNTPGFFDNIWLNLKKIFT